MNDCTIELRTHPWIPAPHNVYVVVCMFINDSTVVIGYAGWMDPYICGPPANFLVSTIQCVSFSFISDKCVSHLAIVIAGFGRLTQKECYIPKPALEEVQIDVTRVTSSGKQANPLRKLQNNKTNIKSMTYSSEKNHTDQLDFCNWLADSSTRG